MGKRNLFPPSARPANECSRPFPAALEALEARLLLDAQWTLMLWMCGDSNLEGSALTDFTELARIGSTDEVKLVAQLDRTPQSDEWFGYDSRYGDWANTRRGLIYPHDLPTASWGASVGEVNMGDPAALKTFVSWAQTTYPAERYGLIFWGHGDGFYGACFDETSGEDALTPSEIESILPSLSKPIDLIGFDACLMSMLEVAYQFWDDASIFVGSQETESSHGWSYHKIVGDLTSNPGWSAGALADAIVQRFKEDYDQAYAYDTLSAITLSQLGGTEGLAAAVNNFADVAIHQSSAADVDRLKQAWYASSYFGAWDRGESDYTDLGTFLDEVIKDQQIAQPIRTAAQAARTAYDPAIRANFSGEWAFSTGISIYLPQYGTVRPPDYTGTKLRFADETMWGQFLDWWSSGAQPTADLDVLGAGRVIPTGSMRPEKLNGTDFGSVVVGSQRMREFTLRNSGSATLQLTGNPLVEITGAGAADFVVTAMPDAQVGPGRSATLSISFRPTTGGLREATVRIRSSDADENPCVFAIRGTAYAPGLSVSDAAVQEGDSGTAQLVFKVTISEDPTVAVEVTYATSDNTAQAGEDYQAAAGTLVFLPGGPKTQTISVTVLGDLAPELDETLFLNLSQPKNATLGRSRALGTILNEDGQALPFGGGRRAAFPEYDGDLVTVWLSGTGSGTVLLDNDAHVVGICLTGTSTGSSLSVSVRKAGGGDGTIQVGGIQVDGSLRAVSAKAVRLAGPLRVSGLCGSVALDDLLPGSTVLLNVNGLSHGPRDTVTLAFDRVADASVNTGGLPIRSLTATEWLNGEGTPFETITAPSLGRLTIKGDRRAGSDGDFLAGLLLDGSDNARQTLGSAKIAGAVAGTGWDITGPAGAVTIAGATADWTLYSSGGGLASLASLTLGIAESNVVVRVDGAIGAVRAAWWTGGSIVAETIKSLTTTGNRRAGLPGDFTADLSVTGAQARGLALGSARIDGAVGGTWRIDGDAGAVTISGDPSLWRLHGNGAAGEGLRNVKSLTVGDAAGCRVQVEDVLASLRAVRWTGGSIQANRIDRLAVTGNKRAGIAGDFAPDELTVLGQALPARKAALGSATVAGDVRDSVWLVTGSVGKVSVTGCVKDSDLCAAGSIASLILGAAEGSDFFAGIDPASLAAGDRRADALADFTDPTATIGSIQVRGWRLPAGDPTRFLTDSNFSAPSIGVVSLTNASGGPAYGLHVGGDQTHLRSVRLRDTLYPNDPGYNGSWRRGQEWLVAGTGMTIEFI